MSSTSMLLKAVQHPIRRNILHMLNEVHSPIPYSEFLYLCGDSTGKLNYHLRILSNLLDKSDDRYVLSDFGKKIVKWLDLMLAETVPETISDVSVAIIPQITPAKALKIKFYTIISIVTAIVIIFFLLISYVASFSLIFIVWISAIFLIMFLTSIIFSRLYYYSINYEITETEIIVHRGIITKSQKTVPYRTVTNIEVKQGPFDRLFNIASIEIQTAGYSGSGVEERLSGLVAAKEIATTIMEKIRLLNPPKFVADNNTSLGKSKALLPILNELREINQLGK